MTTTPVYGDPNLNPTLSGKKVAKNQSRTGVDNTDNILVGDVDYITGKAKGGNDTLKGGNSDNGAAISNTLYGDALYSISQSARGGNDKLFGGSASSTSSVTNSLYGDSHDMNGSAKGGNDTLTGGSNSGSGTVLNDLYGDAQYMYDSVKGGKDTLIGGSNSGSGTVENKLVGDASHMGGYSQGGDDTLVGGSGTPAVTLPSEPIGGEFKVNTFTNGTQDLSSVAALADGGFVVTWSSQPSQDGSGWGVFAQRFDADGNAVGSEFKVNTYTTNDQLYPSIAGLDGGGFVVTWTSVGQDGSDSGIFAQRYDALGNPAGDEFQVNTYTTGRQSKSSVTGLADGSFVVVWESRDQDGSGYGVYAQLYDATGNPAGDEFGVNTFTSSEQLEASVAALNDGGFVVTWGSHNQNYPDYDIYAQRFDASGNPAGSEFQVNTYTNSTQINASVAGLADGGFVVAWESQPGQDGSSWGIYAQRYDASGNAVGGEFRVNTYTTNTQIDASVAGLDDGGFMVTWASYVQDGSFYGIYGQYYDASGTAVDQEFRLNETTIGNQESQTRYVGETLAVLADGKIVSTWSGAPGSEVYARLFTPPESAVTATNTLVGDAVFSDSTAHGGDDRLISGTNATDYMYGDWQSGSGVGGADTFVFADAFGSDYIYDFDQAEGDKINFQLADVDTYDDLTIIQDGPDTVITTPASATDKVTLVDYNNSTDTLTADDFLFT